MLQYRTIRLYFSACCLLMKANKPFLVVIAVFFYSNSRGTIVDISSCSQRFFLKRLWFFRRFYGTKRISKKTAPSKFPDQRVKGTMRTSGETDLSFPLKLTVTLVESTYPSQRPQCSSLSPHFLSR